MASSSGAAQGGGSGNPLSPMYTKDLPPIEDVDMYMLPDLRAFAKHMDEEVGLVAEECRIFSAYLQQVKDKEHAAAGGRDDDDGVDDPQAPSAGGGGGGGGRRRGRNYRRKSSEQRALVLTIEEKTTITAGEAERLKAEKDKTEKVLEDARETFRATLEESVNRIKEVKMEMASFKREAATEKAVSAEKVLKYMQERPEEQLKHIAKTREKVAQSQQQITKYLNQLRQRENAGETFHEIDFSQLEIENQQFLERIDQKNEELVELKGTTTRTVQTLNGLTDKLNALSAEQLQLRRELKLRKEHVDKLTAEIESVKKEGAAAQKKNTALKIQHESVKVPKVEDYIAQKAETHELQKAVLNWKRKVEIASGHVAVMKQQMMSLRKKLGITVGAGSTSNMNTLQ